MRHLLLHLMRCVAAALLLVSPVIAEHGQAPKEDSITIDSKSSALPAVDQTKLTQALERVRLLKSLAPLDTLTVPELADKLGAPYLTENITPFEDRFSWFSRREGFRDLGYGIAQLTLPLYAGYLAGEVVIATEEERIVAAKLFLYPNYGTETPRAASDAILAEIGDALEEEDKVYVRSYTHPGNASKAIKMMREELGCTPEPTVPTSSKKAFDTLMSPASKLTVGGACGYSGTPPRGRPEIDSLVENKQSDLVRAALRSLNPEARVYAAKALSDPTTLGANLSANDKAAIEKIKASPVMISSCGGCMFSYSTAKEILEPKKAPDKEDSQDSTNTTPAEQRSVPELLERIKLHDALVRQSSAEELLSYKSELVPHFQLLAALADNSDTFVRTTALQLLGKIAYKPETIPIFSKHLEDQHLYAAVASAAGLVSHAESLESKLPLIKTALKDPRNAVYQVTVRGLATLETDNEQVVDYLSEAATSGKGLANSEAAKGLAQKHSRSDKAFRTILQLANDPAFPSRYEAVENLWNNFGDRKETVTALVTILENSGGPGSETDPGDSLVRSNAIKGLGTIGTPAPEVVNVLIAHLKDKPSYVASNAAQALGNLHAEAAVPALGALLQPSNPNQPYEIRAALEKIGTPEARAYFSQPARNIPQPSPSLETPIVTDDVIRRVLPKGAILLQNFEASPLVNHNLGYFNACSIAESEGNHFLRFAFPPNDLTAESHYTMQSGCAVPVADPALDDSLFLTFRYRTNGMRELRLTFNTTSGQVGWNLAMPTTATWKRVSLPLAKHSSSPLKGASITGLEVETRPGMEKPSKEVWIEIDDLGLEGATP